MLKLRTLLLRNFPYLIILFLTLLLTILRLILPSQSIYKLTTTKIEGIVSYYNIDGDKLNIILGKEKVLGTYYFKTENEKNTFQKNIYYGDKYKIIGNIKKVNNPSTRNLFNYPKYLKTKGINYTFNITSIKKISSNKNLIYFLKNKIKQKIKTNPYLNTFILGDKSFIKSEVLSSYQENGISHLFAISGMHISLLSSIILFLLKKLKLKEEKRYLITSILLLFYLFAVGLSPSILRGVLFFILFSINKIKYLYIKSTNLYIIALSITLLINPFYVYDVGFLYSFTISLSLLISLKNISSKNYLLSLFKTSLVSFLSSLPIQLYFYHQINLLSIVYNLFFVPLVSFIIFPSSLLTFFISPLNNLFNLSITILENLSLFLSKIKILILIFQRLNLFIYLLYLILAFLYLNKQKKSILVILLTLLLIHYFYPLINNKTYIKMIDVGQGDSILLHSKNESILIDTGGVQSNESIEWKKKNKSTSIAKNTTIPILKSLGIKRLKYLVLTHGDYDHLGEAINLIDNFKVEKIIINSNNINNLENTILKRHKKVIVGTEGLSITCGYIKLIELNIDLEDENDSSQIYYAKYKNRTMLFTGDASKKSEKVLLDNYNLDNIDILKVGHHGSNTSTSEELLKVISPNIAIMSLGKDNKFKHPSTEVLKRLEKYNVNYYRTDISGTITIDLENLTVEEDKKR